ncbi:MAG: response regulator [Deltaproteobacteria bacterium]|nr:response regulator [Deltaproteobacteria bacterium]
MKKRILIVEDEIDLLDLVDFNLSRKGFATAGAIDGVDAMQKLDAFNPDLVVLDLMMPRMNGWEVCRAIKARNRELPVIMLTAKCAPEDKVMGFETGADDYVTKPFNIKELVIRINNLLEKKTHTEFSRILIHEVANRMATIGCYSELLSSKRGPISEENQSRYLRSISSQVANTAELIGEIGHIVSTGEPDENRRESASLAAIIKDLSGFYGLAGEHKGIKVAFEDGGDMDVGPNAAAVKQALTNLIGNAVKYGRENGSVEISTIAAPKGVVVKIKDDGLGIPAADAPHIFKSGFRASNAAKSGASGSGLGLYIVKRLLDRMNATVTFWSDEGVGTTFAILFRRSRQEG